MKYVSNDEKVFPTQEECLENEKAYNAKMLYKKEYVNAPLHRAVKKVRKLFKDFYRYNASSDKWLEEIGSDARYKTDMVGEQKSGIVYLRDDGVNILLKYIDTLEEEILDLKEKERKNDE